MKSLVLILSQSDVKRKQPIVICSHVFSRSYKHLRGLILLCIVNGWFCCLVLL